MSTRCLLLVGILLMTISLTTYVPSQTHPGTDRNKPVLWQRVDVAAQDTYLGPGGAAMQPDLSRIEFIKEEKGGHSTKYRIRDGAGKEWVAKIGDEAQTDTAAARLLWALGYYTDVNYLIPSLTIPGHGTFNNVRLAARPKNVDRKENWSWGKTPFEHTHEMQGLKIMMAFINNWDMKTSNNHILRGDGLDRYMVGDLGASFGISGGNSLPIFWRIGRSRNDVQGYAKTKLVSSVSGNKVRLVYNGKNRPALGDITKEDVRWITDLLRQLSETQIREIFRAARYFPAEIDVLTRTVQSRIAELDHAAK